MNRDHSTSSFVSSRSDTVKECVINREIEMHARLRVPSSLSSLSSSSLFFLASYTFLANVPLPTFPSPLETQLFALPLLEVFSNHLCVSMRRLSSQLFRLCSSCSLAFCSVRSVDVVPFCTNQQTFLRLSIYRDINIHTLFILLWDIRRRIIGSNHVRLL